MQVWRTSRSLLIERRLLTQDCLGRRSSATLKLLAHKGILDSNAPKHW